MDKAYVLLPLKATNSLEGARTGIARRKTA